jgi:hypothetical protein
MARTRTLANLRADVRWQCDQEGATLRHTNAAIDRALNQSIQRFRLKISRDAGLAFYLTKATGTTTAGAVSTVEPYTSLVHGVTNLVWIKSLSLNANGEVTPLEQVPHDAIWEFQNGGRTGVPRAFTSNDLTTILLLPASSGAYPYVLWYLPAGTDLSADGDTFDGIAGWEDWIVFDVCTKLLLRDEHEEQLGVFEGYKTQIWEDIARSAQRGRAGPHKRIDQHGRRYLERRLSRWRQ